MSCHALPVLAFASWPRSALSHRFAFRVVPKCKTEWVGQLAKMIGGFLYLYFPLFMNRPLPKNCLPLPLISRFSILFAYRQLLLVSRLRREQKRNIAARCPF